MKNRLVLRLSWCTAALVLLGCDGYLEGGVQVTTTAGQPVADALVCLFDQDEGYVVDASITDRRGCAAVAGTVSPFVESGRLLVWMPGVEPTAVDVEAGFGRLNEFRLVLDDAGRDADPPVPGALACDGFGTDPQLPSWLDAEDAGSSSVSRRRALERECRAVVEIEVGSAIERDRSSQLRSAARQHRLLGPLDCLPRESDA